MAVEEGAAMGEDGQVTVDSRKGSASPSTSAASSTNGEVEDEGLGCVSSASSGENLALGKEKAVEKQGAGKRRRRRKRKRKKRGGAATALELQPVMADRAVSPSGASDEVISLASDFGRAEEEEEEVIGLGEAGDLPMVSEENPNRTLWRVRRWATEMVSESSESSMSSDVELQSDLEEDGQQTPRWSADAHGSMSDFLWGLGEGGGAGSSSSSSGASNDPMEVGVSAERTVDYMHRLCCAEGQLMRSLANGSNADPRERQTTCPR
ncbi:hypothetical protein FOZ61_011067 [Perkinsus olseni]|uniref:Uncharacterized protein n=1 Tax=Perkinsus olseni TaxID=32597 RepID=A0A7J6M2H1_PEROL|nr:hypothetical protein FOZ61_011067 [Perkinsus olseni]KAF4671699.1 hypothetical protein FOL46_009994 [Perkinsus olseni]